jgi:hypothetical protein
VDVVTEIKIPIFAGNHTEAIQHITTDTQSDFMEINVSLRIIWGVKIIM